MGGGSFGGGQRIGRRCVECTATRFHSEAGNGLVRSSNLKEGRGISRRAFIPGRWRPSRGRMGDGPGAGGEPARRAQGTRPARTGRPFRLIPLNTGECQLGKDHVLGEPYTSDERIAFTIYAFLADGGPGRRVLIDLGPVGLEYINAMFRRFKFFRELPATRTRSASRRGTCSTGSSGWGWAGRHRSHRADAHACRPPRATDAKDGARPCNSAGQVHISRIGWQDNLDKRVNVRGTATPITPLPIPADRRSGGPGAGSRQRRVLPGMEVIYMGGHSVCSQAIRLRTPAGPAISSATRSTTTACSSRHPQPAAHDAGQAVGVLQQAGGPGAGGGDPAALPRPDALAGIRPARRALAARGGQAVDCRRAGVQGRGQAGAGGKTA